MVAFTFSTGTLRFGGLRRGFGIGQIGLGALDGDLVIARIDLHQPLAFLHVLVIVHIDLGHVARDTRADAR